MLKVECKQLMPCSVKALQAFHLNVENLALITPPHTAVTVLETPKNIEAGRRVRLAIRRMGITLMWELMFERVDEEVIIDVALHSPFQQFCHQHRFIAVDANHAMLHDIVEFRMFSGWLTWLGWLVHPFIKRDLLTMFAYRHMKTQQFFLRADVDIMSKTE